MQHEVFNMKKKIWKSKTFWSSILVALGLVGSYMQGAIELTTLIQGIGACGAAIGFRDALK